MTNKTVFEKDLENKKLHVTRHFAAPVEKVWQAWTESEVLDKWWAPRPWKAETKTMNFTEGGLWLYSMVSPENARHWSRVDFKTIEPGKSFSGLCRFCDEDGNTAPESPGMFWHNTFSATADGSVVDVVITFDNKEGFNKIIEMGFEGGFSMGLGNLDELIEEGF